MNANILQLLQSLGIDPQMLRQAMQRRPAMMGQGDRGPPPGMGWRRPNHPGQGHAFGRMGMRPPQAPQMPTAAGAATGAPTPPAPMGNGSGFGQQMRTWAQSKPAWPEGFDGAWGQSQPMQDWRGARPMKPMKPMGM